MMNTVGSLITRFPLLALHNHGFRPLDPQRAAPNRAQECLRHAGKLGRLRWGLPLREEEILHR